MPFDKETIKNSVNLPKTDFPIRAGMPEKEPQILKFWQELPASKPEETENQPSYLLHDGPPYPNGSIHMGHALNKILKDIVVRSKRFAGFKNEFIPGWDCHGLPIETQVLKTQQNIDKSTLRENISEFRDLCKKFALGYVEEQKQEFIRLGITGEWDKPYLTLDPNYEAKVIEVFGKIAENGLIYQGKKPIHWCPSCETALAEAEIEYEDHRSPSVYVKFEYVSGLNFVASQQNLNQIHFLVWTTTPWTLPSNVAIAAHPDFIYYLAKHDNEYYIFVSDLKNQLQEKFSWENVEVIAEIPGKDLLNCQVKHPFLDRTVPVIIDEYVTNTDGTGFVHIAPGHGQEDYHVGLRYKLPIIMPVDNQGKFTKEVPAWEGKFVFDANKLIGEEMERLGTLVKLEFIKHSYPHCWRCKNPVIFRAVEQWFIAVDKPYNNGGTLRERALSEIKKVTWYPDWGENRITGMIQNRPDWCISRQRFWGIPLPIFICEKCGNPEMKGIFNKAVVDIVQKEGSIAWFTKKSSEILPADAKCSKCGAKEFKKETDILDVWFESGSSFWAVLGTGTRQKALDTSEAQEDKISSSEFERDEVRFEKKDFSSQGYGADSKVRQARRLEHERAEFIAINEHASAKSNEASRTFESAPAQLYLEGSDQHRGWFQSSLLIGLASIGKAPFENVLTHGFLTDDKGKKMSKSLGNVISPNEVIKTMGADVLRFWAASSDFKNNDVSISQNVLKQAQDAYSKIRNTMRFLLSNLDDFDLEKNVIVYENLNEIDQWILAKLFKLTEEVKKAYANFEFHFVTHQIHDFASVTLSSLYLDMVKDRLYCDAKDSKNRRSTQTALYFILDALLKLIAPIMVFTAEDAFSFFRIPGGLRPPGIHLEKFPQLPKEFNNQNLSSKWEKMLKLRDLVYQQLEILRNEKIVRSFLEAEVDIVTPELIDFADWSSFFMVSKVTFTKGTELKIEVKKSSAGKCERCWRILEVNEDQLCDRCFSVLK